MLLPKHDLLIRRRKIDGRSVSYASANTLAGNQLVFPQVNSAKWLIYEPFRAFHSAGKRFASGTALFRSTRSFDRVAIFLLAEKKGK